jgi:hypothetical protein
MNQLNAVLLASLLVLVSAQSVFAKGGQGSGAVMQTGGKNGFNAASAPRPNNNIHHNDVKPSQGGPGYGAYVHHQQQMHQQQSQNSGYVPKTKPPLPPH